MSDSSPCVCVLVTPFHVCVSWSLLSMCVCLGHSSLCDSVCVLVTPLHVCVCLGHSSLCVCVLVTLLYVCVSWSLLSMCVTPAELERQLTEMKKAFSDVQAALVRSLYHVALLWQLLPSTVPPPLPQYCSLSLFPSTTPSPILSFLSPVT